MPEKGGIFVLSYLQVKRFPPSPLTRKLSRRSSARQSGASNPLSSYPSGLLSGFAVLHPYAFITTWLCNLRYG